MEFNTFLLLQVLAHVFADYFFQTNKLAKNKNEKGFKSKFLIWHGIIVFVLAWLFSFQWNFVLGSAVIAVTHYLIDGFKPKLNKHKTLGNYSFFLDQGLHLLIIVGVVFLFNDLKGINSIIELPFSFKTWFLIAAYLLCLKPANVFIKEVFNSSRIIVSTDNEMPNAGKLIGILERLLTLTFIVVQQYEAVGFLIAAKSILRYRDDETLKTEYVLIGTMLSFGIAVMLGIIANLI